MVLFGARGAWQGQERLGPAARRAVQQAEAAGAARGLRWATPDLLLLALLDAADGVPARALDAAGMDLEAVRRAIDGGITHLVTPANELVPLDDAAREGVILGLNEARRGGFEHAGAGHILLGVVEARSGAGARLLIRRGIRIEVLREAIDELEQIASEDGAVLFAGAFSSLLKRIGGARACPRCGAALHASFNYCYNCGAALEAERDGSERLQ